MKGVRILIVEDESIVASDIEYRLNLLGYTVLGQADSGPAAIEKAHQLKPDLILMDVMLKGGMDGIETADIIQEQLSIPIIFLTAFTDFKTVNKALNSSPFAYIIKPFEDRELETAIDMALYRSLMERLLHEEKQKAQKYLEIAGVAIMVLSSELMVTMINRKGCEILEYPEKEILGKMWFDNYVPERLRDQIRSVFRDALDSKVALIEYYENPIVTRSGRERIIAWHNKILFDDKGNFNGILCSGEDVTERRKAENALLLTQFAVDHASDGVFWMDRQGKRGRVSGSAPTRPTPAPWARSSPGRPAPRS